MSYRQERPRGTSCLPVLPLRDVLVFPGAHTRLVVGRPRSITALGVSARRQHRILLVAQRHGDRADPHPRDLYDVGTVAHLVQTLELPDGNAKVLVEGLHRGRIRRWLDTSEFFEAEVDELVGEDVPSPELQALVRSVKATFARLAALNRAVPPELAQVVGGTTDAGRLADLLAPALRVEFHERQELLATIDAAARLDRVHRSLLAEIEYLQVERKLEVRLRRERDATQREQWLDEQMKAIQRELGEKEGRGELEELAQQLAAKQLPDAVRDRAEKELRKLAQMNLLSAEATVVRGYLDWIVALPWTPTAGPRPGPGDAVRILDEDHHGLDKVKERILEYLAVASLVDRVRGPILCLVGPPGVGKTSLARSIARATGRPFVRIALGGVRDEAEVRGHRRTYIGAMPGKVLHAMKRAEVVDAVLLLDEVDKMSVDFRGDPAAALLEVLDPEQNHAFNDHYLDLDYDLSRVTFVCTANTLNGIPHPLLDRLEVIELPGYTEAEKLEIARRYLFPRQVAESGLVDRNVTVSDGALQCIVRRYTREAGVRDLERQLAAICRRVARRVVEDGADGPVDVTEAALHDYLGPPRFDPGAREAEDRVGLVHGLAVSAAGGELLGIEVAAVPGRGKLILTGRLGDWLKESANAAFTYIRSRAAALGLAPDFHEASDFHVHYPGNAANSDGPSAGITMAVALVSALTGIPVRSDTAMTGEITLRGRVLRVGGVRDKLLAAHRGGIARVIVPQDNLRDLHEVPEVVCQALEIVPVSHMDDVLREALAGPLVAEIFGPHVASPESAVHSAQAEGPAGRAARLD